MARKGGTGGGNGGGTPRDPLIEALIQKLPSEGPWEAAQRVTWLQMIAMAFQMSYGQAGEIEIKLKPNVMD